MAKKDENLKHDLRSPNRNVREDAVELLIGSQRAINAMPFLIEMLDDQDLTVREKVIIALNQIGSEALMPLLNATRSSNDLVRHGAIKALGQAHTSFPRVFTKKNDEVALPVLLNLMKSKSSRTRAVACETIWPLAISTRQVKLVVSQLVIRLGDEDSDTINNSIYSIGFIARHTEASLDIKDAVRSLIQLRKTSDSKVIRDQADWALAEIGKKH